MSMTLNGGCVPPPGTALDTRHWLADGIGELWVLHWTGRLWRHSDATLGQPDEMHRLGWRYLVLCHTHRRLLRDDEPDDPASWIEISGLAYRNDDWPQRRCDHCGWPYRGPAVYCCRTCALADA